MPVGMAFQICAEFCLQVSTYMMLVGNGKNLKYPIVIESDLEKITCVHMTRCVCSYSFINLRRQSRGVPLMRVFTFN